MADTRTLAERLFAAIDDHRYDDAAAVLQPEAVMDTPLGAGLSTEAWLGLNRSFAGSMPDGRHTLREVHPDGDRCAVEGTWSGTHTGPLATPGGEVPPTGRSVVLPFCAVVTRRGDRIAALTVYFDSLSMFVQLGLAPEPAAA
jgi:predicted ester cyclase